MQIVYVAIITGSPTSPLASISDDILLIQTSNKDSSDSEKVSTQPMGSLFEQVSQLICDTMVLELMEQSAISADDMRKRHANIE
jgi:6-phospho-3-hexuloisomerase